MDPTRKALVPRHIRQKCKKADKLCKELKKLNQQPTRSLEIRTKGNGEVAFPVKYGPTVYDDSDTDTTIDSVTTTDESCSDSDEGDQLKAPFVIKEETKTDEGFNEALKAGNSKGN